MSRNIEALFNLRVLKGLDTRDDLCSFYPKPIPLTGIELEMESLRRLTSQSAVVEGPWQVVEDPSLRNGCEMVSHVLNGARMNDYMIQLGKFVENNRWQNTLRCSTHIHINMRDWSVYKVKLLYAVYATVENLLFSFTSPERIGNNYCYSVTALNPDLSFIVAPRVEKDLKYCALNAAPLRTFGTIEFRHLEGFTTIEKLKKWITLLYDLYYYVQTSSGKQIKDRLNSLNTTSEYIQYLTGIFGTHVSYFPGNLDLQEYLEEPITWAKLSIR